MVYDRILNIVACAIYSGTLFIHFTYQLSLPDSSILGLFHNPKPIKSGYLESVTSTPGGIMRS